MNCRKAIKQLPAYLDHELCQREVTELERHLEVCVFCSTELASLRASSKMLDAWEGILPRRSYTDAVINRIRAEERGVTANSGIRLTLLGRRCVPHVLRTAAAIVFVLGVTVFSGHVPLEKVADEIALEKEEYMPRLKGLILPDVDLMYSHIRPSEYGLVRSMDNRSPFIKTSSGSLPAPGSRDGRFFPEGGRIPEVNHIYFPGEGMPMESVIPLETP